MPAPIVTRIHAHTEQVYTCADPYPSLEPAALRALLLPGLKAFAASSVAFPILPQIESQAVSEKPHSPKAINQTTEIVDSAILRERSVPADAVRHKLLDGTNVLLVQGGGFDKAFIYARLSALGVRVYLLDAASCIHANSPNIRGFIPLAHASDNSGAKGFAARALAALRASPYANVAFHAVTTYYEDAVANAAYLAAALGVRSTDPCASDRARSKFLTRRTMAAADLPTPKFALLSPSDDDEAMLSKAISTVGFPAVLKPSFGAASIGVVRVDCEAELREQYKSLLGMMASDGDPLWLQGMQVVYEEYYDGDEFDVDVIMSEGEAVYAKVSDNWAVLEPHFQETGMSCPSLYPKSKQNEMVKLSVGSVHALGFKDGVLHVECRYTSRGARIIEVNGRMGGDPVHEFNERVWGVDLVEQHLISILGIPARPLTANVPKAYVAEFAFNAPCSGTITNNVWLEHLKADERILRVRYFKKEGEKVVGPEDGVPDWIGEIIVIGKTGQEEVNHLVKHIVTQEVQVPIVREGQTGNDTAKYEDVRFFFPDHDYPFNS